MKAFPAGSRLIAAAAAALLVAGCAWTPITPGMSREQVLASHGTPTRVVPLAAGTRLQYSGQPLGRFANMVDLDAAGRVVSARQVLTPGEFSKIQPGQWSRSDMEREFGPPASIDHVASWQGDIMTYRWQDNIMNMFFYAYLDGNGVVQRTGQGIDFPNRDDKD
ncbi:MAG: hypothetical protein O9353_13000 [Bacteroidia bacterium]|nr:hypothetical protein [Polaromonas sp.]MCZ8286363.1 hypothetical protein [Bacteroidia bacterium]